MIIRNFDDSTNPIEYAALDFQEMMKSSKFDSLSNRGLQMADGSSDIEIATEAPLPNNVFATYKQENYNRPAD